MRCVVQRVKRASVKVDERITGEIRQGLLVFAGIGHDDETADINWLVEKIAGLRIFEDLEGKMNLSLKDVQGEILLVSQFTLLADCRKGRRPSFSDAASPTDARELFDELVACFKSTGLRVQTGEFQALMEVELVNDGPVTILLDSKKNL